MMLTEQEVSEIMIERIMTIETSRNLEKIQVSDQVHQRKDQEIMADLEVQILEMIMTETTGNQSQQPSRNEGFRSVSPQRSENQNRGNEAVRSGGFRSQENKASESRSSGNNGRGNGNSNGNRGGGFR